jgi:nucleoside-diphosphate-sugar epimerase
MDEPSTIQTEEQLDDLASEPTDGVVETLGRLPGDIMLLGVAGKMGPTLARMARRASDAAGVRRRVIGVSRFSSGGQEDLHAKGIETICCDLLDEEAVARLPDAGNVVYLAGMKFGTTGCEATTWAMNSYLPGVVCRRYRHSRIVAFSTGNVYGLTPVERGGSREEDTPAPVGEYAMSCLGRERIFEYFSRTFGTQAALLRLNYACDLRYGVLVDLARCVWARETIDLGMGYFNTIWQGDANAMALRAFDHVATPPWVVNVTGPELLSVRAVCERLGGLMNRPVRFAGTEGATALVSNARRGLDVLGPLRVGCGAGFQAADDAVQLAGWAPAPQAFGSANTLVEWVADWVLRRGRWLDKPTHFESRDGRF